MVCEGDVFEAPAETIVADCSPVDAHRGIDGGFDILCINVTVARPPGIAVSDPGWSRDRYVYAEDVEATIYSAMGIDWTTIRHDCLGRRFEYVPFADHDLYGPVDELWG